MLFYLTAFCLIAGVILIVAGLKQAQREAPETASVRLTRLRERREELAVDNLVKRDHDREFAKREEQRAAVVRKTTFLPSLSKYFMSNAILMRLEDDLSQVHSPWRASELLAASLFMALLVFILFAYARSEEHTSELQSRQYLVC